MTLSVIIPLYNKASYVVRAVESALEQQPGPDEVLIVDDGSTDDGLERLERFAGDSRVRIVRQKNAGEGAARNRGLREMRGEIAAFLDADDEWLPGHLRDILELARLFPEAGLLATGFRTQYRQGVQVETKISSDRPSMVSDYFEVARGTYCVHISSCAARRRAAEEARGFAEGEKMGADLDFYARVAMKHPVAFHPGVSGLYYANRVGSAIHSHQWSSWYPPVVRLLRASPPAQPELARSAEAYADWILAEHALSGLCAGNRSDAAKLLGEVRSPRCAPFRSPALSRLAAEWIPLPILSALIRWRRSRFPLLRRSAASVVTNRVLHRHA